MLKKIFDPTLFRFLLVGVVNTLVGYGVMFGLYNLAGLHLWGDPGYWISSAANYLVGSVVSFFLNKHFTFRSREKGPGVVLRFAANITVCWLLAYGLAKPAMGALLSGTALSPQLQGNLDHAGGLRAVRPAQLLRTALFRLPLQDMTPASGTGRSHVARGRKHGGHRPASIRTQAQGHWNVPALFVLLGAPLSGRSGKRGE